MAVALFPGSVPYTRIFKSSSFVVRSFTLFFRRCLLYGWQHIGLGISPQPTRGLYIGCMYFPHTLHYASSPYVATHLQMLQDNLIASTSDVKAYKILGSSISTTFTNTFLGAQVLMYIITLTASLTLKSYWKINAHLTK